MKRLLAAVLTAGALAVGIGPAAHAAHSSVYPAHGRIIFSRHHWKSDLQFPDTQSSFTVKSRFYFCALHGNGHAGLAKVVVERGSQSQVLASVTLHSSNNIYCNDLRMFSPGRFTLLLTHGNSVLARGTFSIHS